MTLEEETIRLKAGVLERYITVAGNHVATAALSVAGHNLLSASAPEFSGTFWHASPNARPAGIPHEPVPEELASTEGRFAAEWKRLKEDGEAPKQSVTWVNPVHLSSSAIAFDDVRWFIIEPKAGVTRLHIRGRVKACLELSGIVVDLFYEMYEGYPAIRKWVEVYNHSGAWLKVDNLTIDGVVLQDAYAHATRLTPAERGAESSVVAFGTEDGATGLIAVNEVPSALKRIDPCGSMGYAQEHFEWVLAPAERFASEPVFYYAFHGAVARTMSAVSRPLDRAVEGDYMRFLEREIGMVAEPLEIAAPMWCSWATFGPHISDEIIREQGRIAAKAGFACVLLDDGWQRDRLGTDPNPDTFPDFKATCDELHRLGVRVGLWLSCFRSQDSSDLEALPGTDCVPLNRRVHGIAMSFATPWRDYYANDLARLCDVFGATYFKQDFSNIAFGDLAEGHENRTLKESYLRGLRGLLAAQDEIRRLAPDVTPELTHEIYWMTPGVPADVAALKHAATFHVPPNEVLGHPRPQSGPRDSWDDDPELLKEQLIEGCHRARHRFYDHRGLPLYGIEFYAAVTLSFRGSLTPEIQDRQVCSWLMGVPSVYAGDLTTLTEEQVAHYRQRFALVQRLQRRYDIYKRFQFSGVPSPTDTDWHWWGKLDDTGCGAVVVLRGDGGEDERMINIPWVASDRAYRVRALFTQRELGVFTGQRLQDTGLPLALPVWGQEILELSPADLESSRAH